MTKSTFMGDDWEKMKDKQSHSAGIVFILDDKRAGNKRNEGQ